MIGLDTSVVLRLLTGEPVAQAEAGRQRLARAVDAGIAVIVTDLALAEAYHALHHHYGVPREEARDLLLRFAGSGLVECDPDDVERVLRVASGGPGLVDRLIHARHRRRGAVTLTFDKRQASLEGAERCREGG